MTAAEPTPERRYTLAEARRVLEIEACRRNTGHGPSTVIHTAEGGAVRAHCECGQISWTPQKSAMARKDGDG